jgi:hypothetical protein
VHGDPGHPGQGPDARRQQPLFTPRQADTSLHGLFDFRKLHGFAGDRGRQDPARSPFDKVCYIGCGVTTGIGAVINTAKVEPGANVVVLGLGGIGLNVVQRARMAGANMIVGVDLNPAREALAWPRVRDDARRQSDCSRGRACGSADRPHRRRRGLQLRAHRQRRRHAPGAGVLPSRLGGVGNHRCGGSRAGNPHPAVPARDRQGVEGNSVRRPGAAPMCRRSSIGTWKEK